MRKRTVQNLKQNAPYGVLDRKVRHFTINHPSRPGPSTKADSLANTVTITNPTNPTLLYREADPVERRRIQAAVIEAHRERVAGFVRRFVPFEHRREAEQVGAIG